MQETKVDKFKTFTIQHRRVLKETARTFMYSLQRYQDPSIGNALDNCVGSVEGTSSSTPDSKSDGTLKSSPSSKFFCELQGTPMGPPDSLMRSRHQEGGAFHSVWKMVKFEDVFSDKT